MRVRICALTRARTWRSIGRGAALGIALGELQRPDRPCAVAFPECVRRCAGCARPLRRACSATRSARSATVELWLPGSQRNVCAPGAAANPTRMAAVKSRRRVIVFMASWTRRRRRRLALSPAGLRARQFSPRSLPWDGWHPRTIRSRIRGKSSPPGCRRVRGRAGCGRPSPLSRSRRPRREGRGL